MPAVSWNYEQYNMREIRRIENTSVEPKVNLSAINFNYAIDVKKGGRPEWLPLKVFDDGQKTFIQFPSAMLVREAPALFVIGQSGDIQLVNYRQKEDYFVVDRLFDKAELRGGQDGNRIVKITKKR